MHERKLSINDAKLAKHDRIPGFFSISFYWKTKSSDDNDEDDDDNDDDGADKLFL